MPGRAAGWTGEVTYRGARYFLFLRWMRVFLSSLRCFFLAMRLRRFLMTDPTKPPFLGTADDGHANTLAR